MHQHMWDSQTLRLHYLVAEDGDIQVDVARALVYKLDSSMTLFDSLESIKELDGAE